MHLLFRDPSSMSKQHVTGEHKTKARSKQTIVDHTKMVINAVVTQELMCIQLKGKSSMPSVGRFAILFNSVKPLHLMLKVALHSYQQHNKETSL